MSSIFNFTGLASGIDTASIVSALVQVESAPIRRMEDTKSQLQSKSDTLETIHNKLKSLQEAVSALDAGSEILGTQTSIDQENVLSLTATPEAFLGSYDITITNVAQEQRNRTNGYSSEDTAGLLGTGTLTIQVGADSSVDIDITSETTLSSLASAINASSADVSAGVIFDGSDYRMVIAGNRTGETDGAIVFSGTTLGLDVNQYQDAESATFDLEGLSRTSESNIIDDAIPGVTLTLLSETVGSTRATISRDTDPLIDKLETFVSSYNDALTKIDDELSSSGADNPSESLFGDSMLRAIRQKLSTALIDGVSGLDGDYTYAASIGLSIDRHGALSLDQDVLQEALEIDPEGVSDLLRNDNASGIQGIMGRLDEVAEVYTDPIDGLLPTRIDGIDDRIRGLDDQIARGQVRIDEYEGQLLSDFSIMEQLMSSLQSQGTQLSAMLAGLP